MLLRGLEAAANGMQALINQNDSTANNVANVNTTGYKKQVLVFQDIYDSNISEKNPLTQDVSAVGQMSVGSQVQKIAYDFSQGNLEKTENAFDLGIEGDGFFKVQSASDNSFSYTRNGSFCLNNEGDLVTTDGDYVLDDRSRHIKVPTNGVEISSLNDIIINKDGKIEINGRDDKKALQTIGVYDFANKDDMVCIGGSKFKPTNAVANKELKAEKFTIEQGSLETSNSNVVSEMIKTVSTSRNYEALSKLVKSNGDSLSEVMKVARL